MTDYKPGDLVDEGKLRAELDAARQRLDEAEAAAKKARDECQAAREALTNGLAGRFPREDELLYSYSKCAGCGAHMAYWPDMRPFAWDCADVLLGRVGTPEDPALVGERGPFQMKPHEHPDGKVVHDRLPFSFWKVKEDRLRKTPRDPAQPESEES